MDILLPLLFFTILFVVALSFAQRSEPLAAGVAAQPLSLTDQHGNTLNLPTKGKLLVLAFFPRDSTSRCLSQLQEFSEAQPEFARLGCEVAFVAIADVQSNAAFCIQHDIAVPLLADPNGRTAKQYGSIVNFGFYRFAKRTTFLIDAKGNISKYFVVTEPVGHCAEVIYAIKTLN